MTYEFRPAVREDCALLIALAGPSGSGKTWTALELAAGLAAAAGSGKVALIDTEARRATHYADRFQFDHLDLRPPFSSDVYRDAIAAADRAGYAVIIIDSMSHEHAGEGGVLDQHDAELTRMAGNDYAKRDACKFAAWIKPKMAHKKMIGRLLQTRAHLIFCLRAEPKTKMIQNARGKMEPVSMGLQPICDSQLMYEMTLSLMLSTDAPGVGAPIKLEQQHRELIDLGKPLDRAVGERLAAWSVGSTAPAAPPAPPSPAAPKRDIQGEATRAAEEGTAEFRAFYKDLARDQRALLKARMPALKSRCEEADRDAAAARIVAPPGEDAEPAPPQRSDFASEDTTDELPEALIDPNDDDRSWALTPAQQAHMDAIAAEAPARAMGEVKPEALHASGQDGLGSAPSASPARPLAAESPNEETDPPESISNTDVFVAQALKFYASAGRGMTISDFKNANKDRYAALSDDQRRALKADEDDRRQALKAQ